MKIAVCIKQVPGTTEGNMDPKTGVLIRAGLEAVVNVYDLSALEAALRLREQAGGEIHVYTMGPQKAREAIRQAYAMGADRGFLLCDSAFAGADVLATYYTLMQGISLEGGYDLILCGRQTTDGDTAQVSCALAKWLDIPHINWVTDMELKAEGRIRTVCDMGDRQVEEQVALPCLLSVEKEAYPPRMPSLKLKISAGKREITQIGLADLRDQEPSHYGLKGSATQVKKIFPPERTKKQELRTVDGVRGAAYVLEVLEKAGWEGNR